MVESIPSTQRINGEDYTLVASTPFRPQEPEEVLRTLPILNILRNDDSGEFTLIIRGLDSTNFEAIVGAKAARRYRSFVRARRGQGYSAEDELVEEDRRADERVRRIGSWGIFGKLFISK